MRLEILHLLNSKSQYKPYKIAKGQAREYHLNKKVDIVQVNPRKKWDPRFVDPENPEDIKMARCHRKAYSFLNDMMDEEIKRNEQELKEIENGEGDRKLHLKSNLQKLKNRRNQIQVRENLDSRKAKIRKEEMRKVQGGLKKRFYMKKSKWQEVEDVAKYESLKQKGGIKKVEKFLNKRRMKQNRELRNISRNPSVE